MARPSVSRGLLRGLAFVAAAAAGYAFGVTADRASAQPGAAPPGLPGTPAALPVGAQPQPKAQPQMPADRRVVAYITNPNPAPGANPLIAITREELGEFLIDRGGYEKLELLVNKKVIEMEAARRGVTVTTVEIRAALEDDLRGLGIGLRDFEKHLLPKYHKTLYEWVEDMIKPKLLLAKMCQDRVKVTEDDLRKAFENKYGERRQAKVICWSNQDHRVALRQWDEARKSDADFDRVARLQAEPSLASGGGLVAPIGRHTEAKDDVIERTLFALQPGEMSQLFDTPSGLMCLKLHAVVPAEKGVTLDDKVKGALMNELRAKRTELEIGKFCQELKKAAQPNVFLKGPPSAEEFREGVTQIINNASLNSKLVPAGGVVRP